MKSDYKTEEFLKKNPVGYLPFLEDGDFSLAESSAIAEYGEL
jgi:glutathione S-transferase